MGKKKKFDDNTIVTNKKARFTYHLLDKYEAGVSLKGWEVKSLREKQAQLSECYVKAIKNELWIIGMNIVPLISRSSHVLDEPDRSRKLLLHKKEIIKIISNIREQRMTCVAISLYWKGDKIKCAIAMAKGKQQHDKRQTLKERQWKIEQQRSMKNAALR